MSLKSLQECGDDELYAYYSPVIMVCRFHIEILSELYDCSLSFLLPSFLKTNETKLMKIRKSWLKFFDNIYFSLQDSTAKCGQLARFIKKVRHNENRLKEYYCAPQLSLENILEILSQAIRLFQDSLIVGLNFTISNFYFALLYMSCETLSRLFINLVYCLFRQSSHSS